MNRLTAKDRAYLRSLVPFAVNGVREADLDDYLDDWFNHDHYDDNPVYSWTESEGVAA